MSKHLTSRTLTAPTEWPVEAVQAADSRFARSALARLTVSPALALEFLAMFSRFEYALKVTKFRKGESGEAKADWKGFAVAVSQIFDPNRSQRVNAAFRYLVDKPPNRLETRGRAISWAPLPPKEMSDADRIIWVIKQVRHNLFHGGKYAQDETASPARDTQLISTSIVLMEELISLDDRVQEAYLA